MIGLGLKPFLQRIVVDLRKGARYFVFYLCPKEQVKFSDTLRLVGVLFYF